MLGKNGHHLPDTSKSNFWTPKRHNRAAEDSRYKRTRGIKTVQPLKCDCVMWTRIVASLPTHSGHDPCSVTPQGSWTNTRTEHDAFTRGMNRIQVQYLKSDHRLYQIIISNNCRPNKWHSLIVKYSKIIRLSHNISKIKPNT